MQGFVWQQTGISSGAALLRYVQRLIDGRSSQQNLTPAIGLIMHFQASAFVSVLDCSAPTSVLPPSCICESGFERGGYQLS